MKNILRLLAGIPSLLGRLLSLLQPLTYSGQVQDQQGNLHTVKVRPGTTYRMMLEQYGYGNKALFVVPLDENRIHIPLRGSLDDVISSNGWLVRMEN